MRSLQCLQLLSLYFVVQASAFSQSTDVYSIPDPTELSVIASSENTSITEVGNHTLVAGGDTIAEVSAVRIEVSGEDGKKGVQLSIFQGDSADSILLDVPQAAKFMEDLLNFQSAYRNGNVCPAREMCVQGVARCRPSQTEAQAICPAYYSRPDGSQGIRISTPRHTFDFPYVEPAVLAEAVVSGIGWHNSSQHNGE